jgi:hypothetical protein
MHQAMTSPIAEEAEISLTFKGKASINIIYLKIYGQDIRMIHFI